MSAYQRRKGASFEREMVNLFKAYNIPAKRISMMETGGVDKGDIEVAEIYKIQCKKGAQCPKFIYDALGHEDIAIFKRDREKALVCMPVEIFIKEFLGGTNEK